MQSVAMIRRELLILFGLVLVGAATSYLLQSTRPLGRYVGDNASAVQILTGKGSPEVLTGAADLTLVVFTDYQCPACRKADPAMRAAIAKDGNIRVVYKDWPIFGERSERAAEVALAARHQGIYAPVHHSLMRSRSFDDSALRQTIQEAGGSWRQLEADLARYRPSITNQLARNSQEAFSLGLQGTPGYLIGPFLIKGALTEDEFLRAFAQARRSGR
ncbi:MAG: DsbA family protein [Sphingopyxis sp.]